MKRRELKSKEMGKAIKAFEKINESQTCTNGT